MTCHHQPIYAERPDFIQLIAGIPFDEYIMQVGYMPEIDGIPTLAALDGFTGVWEFRDSDNGALRLSLTTENGGLAFNAGGVDGMIYPAATAEQITAMAPKDNKGKDQLTIYNGDGRAVAGMTGHFKWRKWG